MGSGCGSGSPGEVRREGRVDDGVGGLPGTYGWVVRVGADAFEEVHSGTLLVAY